jgi:hypothetical protein
LPVEQRVTRLAAQLRDFYASLRWFHCDPAEALVEAVNAMAALSRELSEIADEGVTAISAPGECGLETHHTAAPRAFHPLQKSQMSYAGNPRTSSV